MLHSTMENLGFAGLCFSALPSIQVEKKLTSGVFQESIIIKHFPSKSKQKLGPQLTIISLIN